ncbi:hypothetical protein KZO01_26090 [Kurthia zopfii]|nr:hypothetical protein KZO01_26090 [Kurthia zopfii]
MTKPIPKNAMNKFPSNIASVILFFIRVTPILFDFALSNIKVIVTIRSSLTALKRNYFYYGFEKINKMD